MAVRTLIIAEPGCTHEGDYDTLVRLLHTAADCGADVFKPGWVSDPDQMCARRHIGIDHPKRAYYRQAYGWLAFPVQWHAELRHIANERGMAYACTTFLPQDVETMIPFVEYHKVASFEAFDGAMQEAHRQHKSPVLISLGMCDDAVLYTNPFTSRLRRGYVQYLHCVSAYPAPLMALQLGVLSGCDSWFDGLSDHSRHLLTGAVAVARGARIIETHYRLDDCDIANPDYSVAFTPAEFKQYIQNVRDAEVMLGDGVKRQQSCEAEMAQYRVVS